MSDVKKNNKTNDLKVAFIADDVRVLNEFEINFNATFALMLAAQELNAKVLFTESNNLKIVNNKVFAKFEEVELRKEVKNHLKIISTNEYDLETIDVIFARKDPPINENYLSFVQTLLLVPHFNPLLKERSSKSKRPLIINNPTGIVQANEKLYALNFPNLIPPTLVTSKEDEILRFLNSYQEIVLKPLFNKGGEGVFYLSKDSRNNLSIIETATLSGSKKVLVQKYLKEVLNGDKRIVMLNGKPLGAIYRIPQATDFRTSVRHGASIKVCDLSERDLEICETLKPFLIKDGLYFVSIDVIGDYLIEINLTCPASLQEVERCTGKKIAREIVDWAVSTASSIPYAVSNI